MVVMRRLARTGREPRRALWVAPVGVAVIVCATAVVAVGAITTVPMTGHPTPDVRVGWLLPATRLVADVSGAVTVGCLLAACMLLPGQRIVSPAGYRWLRYTTWSASVWALASTAAVPGMLVEFLNADLDQVSPQSVVSFVWAIPEGRTQAAVIALAGLVAVSSRAVLTMAGARTLLLVSLAAVVPPAVLEYLEADGNRFEAAVALASMVLHMTGALAWSGALLALLLLGRGPVSDVAVAVRRFSRFAPVLVLAVGAGGLLNAVVELAAPGELLTTDFGRLVLLKTVAFGGLVAVGWWHRRRSLPALTAGERGVFRRIAGVELVIFAASFGLAVALARTPAPEIAEPGTTLESALAPASALADGDRRLHGTVPRTAVALGGPGRMSLS